MPLFKSSSKKAVGKNIEAEMSAGKPQKQSIAIALDVQRRAKKKKMAYGGKAEDDMNPRVSTHEGRDDEMGRPMSEYMGSKWAEGGRIDEEDGNPHLDAYEGRDDELAEPVDEYMANQWSKGSAPKRKPDDERLPMDEYMDDQFAEGGSVVDRIMQKRMKGKPYAEGGEVEGPEHDSESPADMWEESEEAGLKENYSDSDSHPQPKDSNEHGHDLSDEDMFDMVDQIRKKLKSRK